MGDIPGNDRSPVVPSVFADNFVEQDGSRKYDVAPQVDCLCLNKLVVATSTQFDTVSRIPTIKGCRFIKVPVLQYQVHTDPEKCSGTGALINTSFQVGG